MLLDEHLPERHGRTGYVLREGLARLGGGGGDLDREVYTEATVCPAQHVPGQPIVEEARFKKKATMLERKYWLNFARSRDGTWTK